MTGAEARGEGTRDALFDAAKLLFRELGYTRTSHADITAEAGIGRTTFYEHFTSKEDLLVQLVERDLPALIDEILRSVDPSLPPDVRLRELTVRVVEFVGTDHIGLILHTEVPKLSPDSQEAIGAAHGSLATEFMDIYRRGVSDGSFRQMPPMLAGRLIESTMMMGGRVVMDMDEPKAHAHEIADATAGFLAGALRREN
jgi:AcrR family transcriptional regulator